MKKGIFIVKEKIKETEHITTLVLKQADGEPVLEYEAGQYVHLVLGKITKMYTLSSAPHEDLFSITIERKKFFSAQLCDIKIGENIGYLGPTGFMVVSEIEDKKIKNDLVFIAAGVGVTPFYSIIKTELHNKSNRKQHLFYVNKNKERTCFNKNLNKLEGANKNFYVHNYWSNKENKLTIEKIKSRIISLENKIFFICGSVPFVDKFWRDLRDSNVPEEAIFTESFLYSKFF